MTEAESFIETLITHAFEGVNPDVNDYGYKSWRELPDEWLEKNEDLFLYYSHEDELFLLPAFLCYLLRKFLISYQSVIYIHISETLRQYSKEKSRDSFKYSISKDQFNAIKALIKHYRYNMPSSIDEELWEKILKNWSKDV